MVKRFVLLAALPAIAVALSGCGKTDTKNTSGQIAAKVNGDEISVREINSVIAHDISPEQARQAAAQVLERIIDQELLVQKALEAKLDRDPQVVLAIEGAKRQILARAYIERAVTDAMTESKEEVSKFYKENPALFERRRIYRVHELLVDVPRGKFETLKAAATGVRSLDEVAGWLKSRKLTFHASTSSKPAEQIPMNVLVQVSGMSDGQIAVFPTSRGASVLQLLQSEEVPLSEQQAAPLIERYLVNHRRLEAAQEEIRRLRQRAKIEYVGDFETPHAAPVEQHMNASARSEKALGEDEDVETDGHLRRGFAGLR